jgi:NitT/TauT family transport system substrate-binding protein
VKGSCVNGRAVCVLFLLAVACAPSPPPASQGTSTSPAAIPAARASATPEIAQGASPLAKPPTPSTVRSAQNGVNALNWVSFVAADQGFYEREGLNVEATVFTDTTVGLQALVSGSLDVGTIAPDSVIRAVRGGGDLKILAGTVGAPPFSLIVRPEIKSFADLRGQKLGSSALKGNITAILKKVLETNGLKGDDYDLVVVGGTTGRFAALQSGGIAGALLAQPEDLLAVQGGLLRLVFAGDVLKDYQTEVQYARAAWTRENPDAVTRFLRAKTKATEWFYDPANKEEAVKILVKYAGGTEEVAAQTYDLYIAARLLPHRLELNSEGMSTVIQIMADDGDLEPPLPKAGDFVDSSFLQAAAR